MRRALAILATFAAAGCTSTITPETPPKAAPALRLISYDTCEKLLPALREAARESVGMYGLGGYDLPMPTRAEAAAGADAKAAAPPVQGQDYSGTNTHTSGVDEPDLIKTDGKRIITVNQGHLKIIDAASKQVTGTLSVDASAQSLLLQDDRVLVLSQVYNDRTYFPDQPAIDMYMPPTATHVQLVSLSDKPKVIGDYRIEASLVDARQVGNQARVVVQNAPKIKFPPWQPNLSDEKRLESNKVAVASAPISSWLPGYTVNGQPGTLDCGDVSRPDVFSGLSMVTILSFDLGGPSLTDGEPVAVMADGRTVYGSGPNLYLAHDQRWMANVRSELAKTRPMQERTELFQFDVTAPRPVYVASGSVPGFLLNQYSMSEHNGVLRIATTVRQTASTVYALRRNGGTLAQIGEIGGLGKGERIYAVRFVGTVAYVVTFRQTDPLYTIDFKDPANPKVLGELKIPGYSAYLHPVGADRLIGLGQDATDQGRVTGTQISLFDVGNLADPKRIAQFKIPRSYSQAEYDPHAFLYWPQTGLLVVPVNNQALLMKVGDNQLTEVNRVTHQQGGQVIRSLIIGDTLWTLSNEGLLATTLDGSARLAWLPL